MKQKLIFDTTNATTIADTDSVGAYVRAGDDGTLIGHVSDALKVNFSNTTIAVTATDLDIRSLVFATDSVNVSGSEVSLDAATLAALETITVEQGTSPWVIGDGGGSITVDGTVAITDDANKAEDSAHTSGDIGKHVLAVRQDTLAASTSTDGDYASLKVNADGRLYVDVGTISISDAALALTAIAAAAETLDVAATAQDVVVSPLANRKYLWILNRDNQAMFIGQSGVTAANGFPISPGSYIELRAGPAIDIEYVSAKVNHEIRTLELS